MALPPDSPPCSLRGAEMESETQTTERCGVRRWCGKRGCIRTCARVRMACSGGHGAGTWRAGGVTVGVLRSDPVGVAIPVTFLAGTTACAGEDVLTARAMQTLLLQQLVHPLDDALQALVHVQPYFLLPNQESRLASAFPTRKTKPHTPTPLNPQPRPPRVLEHQQLRNGKGTSRSLLVSYLPSKDKATSYDTVLEV